MGAVSYLVTRSVGPAGWLSLANKGFKHTKDAAVLKEASTAGKRSVAGETSWLWGCNTAGEWCKNIVVPAIYTTDGATILEGLNL